MSLFLILVLKKVIVGVEADLDRQICRKYSGT